MWYNENTLVSREKMIEIVVNRKNFGENRNGGICSLSREMAKTETLLTQNTLFVLSSCLSSYRRYTEPVIGKTLKRQCKALESLTIRKIFSKLFLPTFLLTPRNRFVTLCRTSLPLQYWSCDVICWTPPILQLFICVDTINRAIQGTTGLHVCLHALCYV